MFGAGAVFGFFWSLTIIAWAMGWSEIMRKLILAALLLPGTALANNTTINGPAYSNQQHPHRRAPTPPAVRAVRRQRFGRRECWQQQREPDNRIVVAPALPGMASPCTRPGGGVSFGVVGFAGGAGYQHGQRDATRARRRAILIQVSLPDHARG